MRSVHAMLIGMLLVCCLPVQGRVFRVTDDTHGRLNAAGLPWQQAYSTTMNIDGRRNDVVVYAARFDEPAAEQLKAQFERQGATVSISAGPDGGAVGTAKWDDGEARILVLPPSAQPSQIIYLFYPEAAGSSTAPAFPVPEYPRGQVVNTVVNEKTRTFCAMLSTTDPVMQVQRFYIDALTRDGWAPLLRLSPASGLTWFHKGERCCCVLARLQENGETRVTLLVRDNRL